MSVIVGSCNHLLWLHCLLLLHHHCSLLSSWAWKKRTRPSLQLHCLCCLRSLLCRILRPYQEILYPLSWTTQYFLNGYPAATCSHRYTWLAAFVWKQYRILDNNCCRLICSGRRSFRPSPRWLRYSLSRLPTTYWTRPQSLHDRDDIRTSSESILGELHLQGIRIQRALSCSWGFIPS